MVLAWTLDEEVLNLGSTQITAVVLISWNSTCPSLGCCVLTLPDVMFLMHSDTEAFIAADKVGQIAAFTKKPEAIQSDSHYPSLVEQIFGYGLC